MKHREAQKNFYDEDDDDDGGCCERSAFLDLFICCLGSAVSDVLHDSCSKQNGLLQEKK